MADEKVRKKCLEWLGHLARKPDHRLPKSMLFSWLPKSCPRGGPRKRGRDVVRRDLKEIGVEKDEWFEEARRSRAEWRVMYRLGMERYSEEEPVQAPVVTGRNVVCAVCSRIFRQESDKKRHNCVDERRKPVWEQKVAA